MSSEKGSKTYPTNVPKTLKLVGDLGQGCGYIISCVLEMTFAVFAGTEQHTHFGKRGVDRERCTEMQLCLLGLAGKEQQDAEVCLGVQIARVSGDGGRKLRNCEIRALLAEILIGLLLMGVGLRRRRGLTGSLRADLWR